MSPVETFLDLAHSGDQHGAIRYVVDLLDAGTPVERVIRGLLSPVQVEVGERWQGGDWSVADEHLVTSTSQAALEALTTTVSGVDASGMVVAACAEGDWHSLPSQMFSQLLRAGGQGVTFLGASTPAEDVASFIGRRRPDALVVTCNLALAYVGTARLADAAHLHGVPVLAGGRGLTAERARLLGADGWAADVGEALELLRAWRQDPPRVDRAAVHLDQGALRIERLAAEVGDLAFASIQQHYPPMADYDDRQRTHTHQDLVSIVRFVAAARLVDDPTVFTDFIGWLESLLAARGVPPSALAAGLASLAPLLRDVDEGAHRLVTAGLRLVTAGQTVEG